MFSVEIRVNGQLIKVVTGLNKGKSHHDPSKKTYLVHLYNLESQTVKEGYIYHNPSDGLNSLIEDTLAWDVS